MLTLVVNTFIKGFLLMSTITEFSSRLALIDGFDLGLKERTGTYVLREQKITLIESGPSPSVSHVTKGLKELGIDLNEVEYIIVTHIHLDHAGGAGLLLSQCPNAKLVVHPKGARHMIDPSRLIAGAKAVYGEQFDQLFNPIVPVQEDLVIIKKDQETLKIGPNCELTFYDTPGHAAHHFSIYDPISNGIFTGDTLGVRYESLAKEGIHFVLPSTSPSQFNPDATKLSLKRIQALNVETIYFGHFSASHEPVKVYNQLSEFLEVFVSTGKEVFDQGGSYLDLQKRLLTTITEYLDELNVPRDHLVYEQLALDLEICSMGIIDYFTKQRKDFSSKL